MIIGGERERNEYRRLSCCRHFGRRGRARSANQHVSACKLVRHVVNKRLHNCIIKSRLDVGVSHFFEIPLAGLMRYFKPISSRRKQRQRSGHRFVDRARTLASTEYQNAQLRVASLPWQRREVQPNRIAGNDNSPPEVLSRVFEAQSRGIDEARKNSIRKSGHRIRLDYHCRDSQQRSHQQGRT